MYLEQPKVTNSQEEWRTVFFDYFDTKLDQIEQEYKMDNLADISKAIFQERSEILGRLILGFIEKKFSDFLNQETYSCLKCSKQLGSRGKRPKTIQTLAGKFELLRPYFYCIDCQIGYYPLDEALCLSKSSKQYDVQDIEAWLSSETTYEVASETYERITGDKLSEQHMYETTNAIGEGLDILDVCPSKETINKLIDEMSEGKFRRPIIMIAIDGAHIPTRPEPTPHKRKGKRGKGKWKEVKGFRIYILGTNKITHLISWHQVCTDEELAENLLTIKESCLIPEEKVRICLIGDGAPWIWNRSKEIFPEAKEILDYYHCSEHLHNVGDALYGKHTIDAQQWAETILTRIYFGYIEEVLTYIGKVLEGLNNDEDVKSGELKDKIDKLYNYILNHRGKMDYSSARRAGYHIGSGAIETSNKFISHTRMKRSGSWWYISNANNMLKIRCAKYNGTYDAIIGKYKKDDQERIRCEKNNTNLKIIQ